MVALDGRSTFAQRLRITGVTSETPSDYFGEFMVNRQLLLWAVATRTQLERWEPLVAANVAAEFGGSPLEDAQI